MNRYRNWLDQARGNLGHAKRSLQVGDYAWACFAAQQAAEMAVKGLHMRLGQTAWGHSVLDLLAALPAGSRPDQGFLERVKILDQHYIPPRYPHAHPAGPAHRHYNDKEAEEAIALAGEVLAYCERQNLEDRP